MVCYNLNLFRIPGLIAGICSIHNFRNMQSVPYSMYDLVSMKQHSPVRILIHEMFIELRQELKDEYHFDCELVGSGRKNTIMRDANGRYDLDYQIVLTRNSKIFKKDRSFKPTEVKQRFLGAMQKILPSHRFEDSTTAITLNDRNSDFSVDFVIIDGTDDTKWKIIRRNNDGSRNTYTWNEMPSSKGYSRYYGNLPDDERYKLKKKIIGLKIKDKELNENRRVGSYTLTMQAIKEHMDRHGHKT